MHENIKEYIDVWKQRCYHEDIPDDAPLEIFDKVPSYKKIAIAILKNDLKILGVTPKVSKYYSMLKKIEIEERELRNT